jgi:hypothetical protein
MAELDDFAYLWDGSQSDWEVERTHYDLWKVEVVFDTAPNVEQARALRRLFPHVRDLGARDAFRMLANATRVGAPGLLSGIEANELARRAAELRLEVEMEAFDHGSMVPVRHGVVLAIEDPELAREVCRRMLAAGVPVVEVEAD